MSVQDQNFWIFLCLGQSNMAGQAPIEEQDLMVSERFLCMATTSTINDFANRYPNTYVVSSEGYLPCSDYLHFSGDGYRLLGRHYTQCYLEAIKNYQI